jgi:hypothetical protein
MRLEVVERLAQKVIAVAADEERVQDVLEQAYWQERTADVLEEEELPAWPQHAPHFRHGSPIVRDRAECEGGDDGIKPGVGEFQGLCIARVQGDFTTEFMRPLSGDLEHGWREIDARQPHFCRVVREIATGTDGDLQDLTACLPADPLPSIADKQLFEVADVSVITIGDLLVIAPHALGLRENGHPLICPRIGPRERLARSLLRHRLDAKAVTAQSGFA